MKRSTWTLFAIGVVVGVAEPRLDVALKCRPGFEHSEGCVWARAYLPLTQVVAPMIVTPLTFAALLAIRWAALRAKRLPRG